LEPSLLERAPASGEAADEKAGDAAWPGEVARSVLQAESAITPTINPASKLRLTATVRVAARATESARGASESGRNMAISCAGVRRRLAIHAVRFAKRRTTT
jgi:hypothetical protein